MIYGTRVNAAERLPISDLREHANRAAPPAVLPGSRTGLTRTGGGPGPGVARDQGWPGTRGGPGPGLAGTGARRDPGDEMVQVRVRGGSGLQGDVAVVAAAGGGG